MNQNIRIRLLQAKVAQVQHLLCMEQHLTAADREDAHILLEVIECVIYHLKWAEIDKRDGNLQDLNDLKYGLRLAGLLLQNTQEREPDGMRGWRYGDPKNDLQRGYDFIYDLAIALGFGIVAIEARYPQHARYFAQERADYVRACDQETNGQSSLI